MRFLKIWLFLLIALTSSVESQVVTPPGLPKLENSEPVNPVDPSSAEKVKPEDSLTRGIFDDSLVRDKTLNSVFAELTQLPAFTSLKTAAEKMTYAEKYTINRITKLIESARILMPGQVAYAISDSDKKLVESFATKISEGKYQVSALASPFDISGQLGPLMAYLSSQAADFPASMTNAEQLKQLSQAGIEWLAEKRVIEPGKLSPSEKKVIEDLSLLIISKKWAGEIRPIEVTPVTNQNRVAAYQPALTDFLKTLPQTLLDRNGPQNFHQVRDQVLDIALRALQQRLIGTQALNDEERQHLVQLVDNVMKPFENLLGKLFQPNHRQINPAIMQPVSPQIHTLQPIVLPAPGFYGGYLSGQSHRTHKF